MSHFASARLDSKLASLTMTSVQVGVRIRPLSHRENGTSILKVTGKEIRVGEDRRFTYDQVFDEQVSQEQLYEQVATPLLQSVLDGYNATIMAYGQTGSGKTFTMGSCASSQSNNNNDPGLIPRFMNDLFHQLQKTKSGDSNSNNSIQQLVDYHLQASFLEVYGEDVHDLLDDEKRQSLPLREDGTGGIVCTGLKHRTLNSAEDALQVLHEGTLNRTTAATLMNLTSSRSHAVFTITLKQVHRHQDADVTRVARFTFVDLAGSERMKKTGAEGERAREGIKINEGLLALGNVINALSEGKKTHVPYRQSKLTRLLQDALGGNSKTLFLACVSPADTNASETLSTLHYAKRARHIQNAPTQNIDADVLELQRYKALARLFQTELVKAKFAGTEAPNTPGHLDEEIFQRNDVKEYLGVLENMVTERYGAIQPLPNVKLEAVTLQDSPDDPNKSIMENFDPNMLTEVNPDEEMAILDQLLELQHRDEEFDKKKKEGTEELKKMDGELAEQEVLLLQLKESLKVYHTMKAKYEKLMAEVQQLENEKAQLAQQLETATHDPSQGNSKAIKKELEKVERSLARARTETRKHREMYRKAEQEAQKCKVLERKISDLKHSRANLIRKQKEAATRHREYTETKTREIVALKRKDRNNEKRMTKLESEILMHKKNLEKRQTYVNKLSNKLKQTETHLMKLLSMRQKELTKGHPRGKQEVEQNVSQSEIKSMLFLIQKEINECVRKAETNRQYEERMQDYSEAMRSMIQNARELRDARKNGSSRDIIEELEHNVQELEVKTEVMGSELESLRNDIAEDSEDVENSVSKLLENKKASLLKAVISALVEDLSETKLSQKRLTEALTRKESAMNSYESEILTLNDTVRNLSDKLQEGKTIESYQGEPDQALVLQKEHDFLNTELTKVVKERDNLLNEVQNLRKETNELRAGASSMQEKVILAEQTLKHGDGAKASQDFLSELQSIWEDLGASSEERSELAHQIENCLVDTCDRVLNVAKAKHQSAVSEAECLGVELTSMCNLLGIDEVVRSRGENETIVDHVNALKVAKEQIEPSYQLAVAKRDELVDQMNALTLSLDMTEDQLPECLRQLRQSKHSQANDALSGFLAGDQLSKCEEEIQNLRSRKMQIITDNAELHAFAHSIIQEMNVAENDIYSVITRSIRNLNGDLPDWWSEDIAMSVIRSVVVDGGVLRANHSFSSHLKIMSESLTSLSTIRRKLSDKLRSIIERAQKALLDIVEGEGDASDVCQSFHQALFRLPALSKDRVNSCIKEIVALVSGVESMTQSEIEALSVVWEALGISSSDRGLFWENIEESILSIETSTTGPFDEVIQLSYKDTEDWLLNAVKEATKSYVDLEAKLFKLEKVHGEVEKLRSKQDAKSSILSLDSEIRILNAKLLEFEENKCNKQRLLTKKSGSSSLLKEERFRKQMQSKFTNKLEQLMKLLKSWVNDEGESFDTTLLSDEVRELLENTDQMDLLVEKRTEFMHLRTTKPKVAPKKRVETSSRESGSTPPRKRQATTTTKKNLAEPGKDPNAATWLPPVPRPLKRKTSGDKENGADVRKAPPKRIATHTERSSSPLPKSKQERVPLSPRTQASRASSSAVPSKRERLTLPPFGHVLEQAMTPQKKENRS